MKTDLLARLPEISLLCETSSFDLISHPYIFSDSTLCLPSQKETAGKFRNGDNSCVDVISIPRVCLHLGPAVQISKRGRPITLNATIIQAEIRLHQRNRKLCGTFSNQASSLNEYATRLNHLFGYSWCEGSQKSTTIDLIPDSDEIGPTGRGLRHNKTQQIIKCSLSKHLVSWRYGIANEKFKRLSVYS